MVIEYFGHISVVISATIGGLTAALLSVFGTSTIACIASVVLTFPLLCGLANLCVEGCTFVLDNVGQTFDYVIEKLRESVFPKIKEIGSKFIAWVNEEFGSQHPPIEPVVVMV